MDLDFDFDFDFDVIVWALEYGLGWMGLGFWRTEGLGERLEKDRFYVGLVIIENEVERILMVVN